MSRLLMLSFLLLVSFMAFSSGQEIRNLESEKAGGAVVGEKIMERARISAGETTGPKEQESAAPPDNVDSENEFWDRELTKSLVANVLNKHPRLKRAATAVKPVARRWVRRVKNHYEE